MYLVDEQQPFNLAIRAAGPPRQQGRLGSKAAWAHAGQQEKHKPSPLLLRRRGPFVSNLAKYRLFLTIVLADLQEQHTDAHNIIYRSTLVHKYAVKHFS